MWEVEPVWPGQQWPNVLKAEKITSSIYRKPTEMEPWLLLNEKSQAAYHLPWSLVSSIQQKGPKQPSAADMSFRAIGAMQL